MAKGRSECPVRGAEECPVRSSEECPVKHSSSQASQSSQSFLGSIFSLFGGSSQPSSPPAAAKQPNSSSPSVEGYNTAANDLVFGHQPQPGQKTHMSQKRTISSIPKSDFTPAHQPGQQENWVYPSQQQYYNAMKRKGYDPAEEDVGVVLEIHNIVNEKGWSQIKEWESLRGCTSPKLKQFEGRPKDVSPKAFVMGLMGYSLPFDRHDWIVDSNGSDVRYVIDFYQGKATPEAPISMHLDVRPAVDNPYSIYHRLKYNIFDTLNIPKVSKVPSSSKNDGK